MTNTHLLTSELDRPATLRDLKEVFDGTISAMNELYTDQQAQIDRNSRQIERNSRKIDQLAADLDDFKQEMRQFRSDVMTGLDQVMGELKAFREEMTVISYQLRRHTDQLDLLASHCGYSFPD